MPPPVLPVAVLWLTGLRPSMVRVPDEAQDVTPLAWRLLRRLNPPGRWTLVGDINQRGLAWSAPSWDAVAQAAGFPLNTARLEEVHSVYRSTSAILGFANALLPGRRRRRVEAVQEAQDTACTVVMQQIP